MVNSSLSGGPVLSRLAKQGINGAKFNRLGHDLHGKIKSIIFKEVILDLSEILSHFTVSTFVCIPNPFLSHEPRA
tara:strand:- start:153 stop:377 length:225 start_codon:yes stop_codon:yes gene_type:complete